MSCQCSGLPDSQGDPLVGPECRKRLEADELAYREFDRLPSFNDCLDDIGGKEGERQGGAAGTFFWVSPVDDMVVILFTQLLPSSAIPVRKEPRALVHGALTGA